MSTHLEEVHVIAEDAISRFLPVKRGMDLVGSAIGLICLAPLLVAVAIAIVIESGRPVIFRQRRVGRGLKEFDILKFRTMVPDAEKHGPAITIGADRRITRVGAVLRKTKLDELPQLWNVLRGDMSLVGPRPEVPKYVAMFHKDFAEILRLRPGITDPASVQFIDEATLLGQASDPEHEYVTRILPQKIALAKDYVRLASPAYDVRLIIDTLVRLLHPRKMQAANEH